MNREPNGNHRGRFVLGLVACCLALACGREGYQNQPDACDGQTCSGHGACVVLQDEPLCVCEDGYYADGLECKELVVDNPCVGVTCSGFGTCAVRNGEAWCVCAAGYHNPPEDKANCVADVHPCDAEDGSPCDDGEFCTIDDTCQQGVCTGQPNPCDDSNSCTVDLCNEIDDTCINTEVADNTPCEDGSYCTVGERCQAAVCTGGQPRNCSDGNPCTDDVCDEQAGACRNDVLADGSACEDGAYCTAGDVCQSGVCVGGAARDCRDGNDCTADVCNESIDACENPPVVDGTPCEDGQYCTVADLCLGGACQAGAARDCSDGDLCTADACDDDLDLCVYAAVPDGTICSDGLFCTLNETCNGGVCGGGVARDCTDGNPCTSDACNDTLDTCSHAAEPDGTICDDGQWCTLDTVCLAGICGSGSMRDCSDGNGCTLDSCDEQADGCVNDQGAMDGAGCDDGDFCTVGDSCSGGACSGQPNPCDDGNPCTTDACDAGAGDCTHTPVANGSSCDDGLYCTVGDVCTAGTCSGTARDCSDGSVCTADSCNEVNDTCVNAAVADGTACDDGQYCNVGETCIGGTCGGGIARNCSDGNQCTADSCDEGADACVNTNVGNGTVCDDNLYCTVGEVCTAGVCGGGAARNCSDGNTCTQDVCNEMSDACEHPAVAEGTPCDDGEYCTLADACSGGVCTGSSARDCSDGNACTSDVCDEVGDSCVSTPVVDGTSCNDGQFCTLGETCVGGACAGGTPRSCSDGNACTADTCDDGADACVNSPVTDGTACDDGAYCTTGETCQGGVCGNSSNRNCSDGNGCTLDYCDEAGDACVHDAAAMDGTLCDDGQFCTSDDACLTGTCVGGGARNCSDGNVCTADSCDEAGDSCVHDAASADGTACNDGAFCTVNDACSGGVCNGGGARGCSDGNPCTVDSCDEAGDACVNDAAAADGNACDDGLYCNVGETCAGGVCSGGSSRACADTNPCTVDSCDEAGDACVHDAGAADGNACDDGLFCNVGETCSAGACQGGGPNGCSDGNACTVDSCDEAGDQCLNDAAAANGNACDDGSYCTVGEVCTGGICTSGLARDCADADPCTADTCNEAADACEHAAVANGTVCDDGAWCTIGESCSGGVCGGGVARSCSDGNQCTSDSCDDVLDACVNTDLADGTACDDGQYCIVGETCTAGACGGGSPRSCSDGNQCTQDSCDEGADGCVNDAGALDGVACDDGNFCLVGETCSGGVCGGGSLRPCDDGNPCTDNDCIEATDSCSNPNKANGTACEDGLFCTSPDTCQAGLCQAGVSDPCAGDPCSSNCDEGSDVCGGCSPAGTYCLNAVQEATCDGACGMSELQICPYACNPGRDECNECSPSTVECKGDVEFLCNAEFICDADGLLQSKSCCSTNRCSCDGSMCLEHLCAASADLSGGGTLLGTTCDDLDNIPGDCNPGGAACRSVASGGAPEEMFQFTLDDGQPTSAFYTVTLNSSASALDTALRLSNMCGSEVSQLSVADVCGAPGTTAEEACSEQAGPETMILCGLPEGTYYGAVDSPAGTCDAFDLDASMTQVDLDDGAQAGNISMGGTFTGNTCGLADDFHFPDTANWDGSACGDCVGNNPTSCPDCGVGAANDCTLGTGSNDDMCTYSGAGSPDAVFYLALDVQSGVDISTAGSSFDTVLFLMETGVSGPVPAGSRRICNDDCWTSDGPSHIQTSLPPGLYYVYLDGAGGDCGDYVLNVIVSPAATCGNQVCQVPYESCAACPLDCSCPNCGDGALDPGEECDDHNTGDGDGCSSLCGEEPGFSCVGEPSVCGFVVNGTSNCACAIPDCNGPGGAGAACTSSNYGTRTDTITIPTACTVLDVNVDMSISHTWRGDLSLDLRSPDGTSVRLKAQNGSDSSADVVGNYDQTLVVEGPGALTDFDGGPGNGTWTLTIHDWWEGDTGTLNSWSLHLTCQ